MKLEFKPEDFAMAKYSARFLNVIEPAEHLFDAINREAAKQANARLQEMLKELPEVHGRMENGYWKWNLVEGNNTHTARLVEIEKINGTVETDK